MTRFVPILPYLLMLLACCGESDVETPPAPDQAPPSISAQAGTARFDFVCFSRLQGFQEGIPCNPQQVPSLAAAAGFVEELPEDSDHGLLVCVDDALQQPSSVSQLAAAEAGLNARADLLLQAMAAAGVDAYVPSHGDFSRFGVKGLLDKAEALGLPVLVSNLDVTGRDLQHAIFLEAHGVTVACLGAIPPQAKDAPMEAGVTIVKPVRRIRQLAKSILDSHQADMIVVFSALSDKTNQRLSENAPANFIIGSNTQGQSAGRIIQRHGAALMGQRFSAQEVGHTTLKIVNGDFSMFDLSALWTLPKTLANEAEVIEGWKQQYKTDDLDLLAKRISPTQEHDLPGRLAMRQANEDWLDEYKDYAGSYVAHRAARLRDVPPDDAVSAILARQADVIQQATAAVTSPVEALDPGGVISNPDSCVSCHREQYEHWASTRHSMAYKTLQQQGRDLDGSCLLCHVVGFNRSGGFQDPRLQAPFGAVGCWDCHQTRSSHATLIRGAVDPALSGVSDREYIASLCDACHTHRRSPDFDLDAAMERVACPPMRPDDPALARARRKAVDAIERHRQAGTSDPMDPFRKGRALIGLGRLDEGVQSIIEFAATVSDQPAGMVEISRYLDDHGASRDALKIIKDFLHSTPSDPLVNTEYVRLLLEATDESVQDPVRAESHIRQVTPDDGDKIQSALLPMRKMQVDALFRTGKSAEAFRLLHRLNTDFPRNDDVQEFVARWIREQG